MTLEAADEIQFLRLDALQPWDRNPRSITDERMRALRDSLRHDPLHLIARPLMVTTEGVCYAGNQRLAAITEEREKLAGGSRLIQHLDAWGGVPVVVDDPDEKTMLERALRDNQAYGEWLLDDLSTLATDYEAEFGSMKLLGIDPEEEAALKAMVDAAREEEAPKPRPEPEGPEVEPRRRTTAYAVTVRFEEQEDRDRFAAELRDAGHAHVQAHVGRWEEA